MPSRLPAFLGIGKPRGAMGGKQSNLNPKSLSDLRDQMHFTDVDIKKFHDVFFKDHPDGKVTKGDLIKIYRDVFPDGDPTPFVEKCMYNMDRNGYADFREFICGIGLLAHGSPEEKLRAVFRAYDLNNNGSISKWEFQSMAVAIYKGIDHIHSGRQTARRGSHECYLLSGSLFEKMDQNGDEKVTFREFVAAARSDNQIQELLGLPADPVRRASMLCATLK